MFASKDLFFTRTSGAYTISRSVRLRSSASAYFNRTPATASNRKTWTWSGWVKRGSLSATQVVFGALQTGTTGLGFGFQSTNTFFYSINGVGNFETTALYRDSSAWYHIVFVLDTTQATQANRAVVYINGVNTAFATNGIVLNNNYDINNNVAQYISQNGQSSQYFDGYVTEVNFIDGQALTPSSFGETNTTTGVWQPKKYAGTYGTNGFYLNFSDNSNNTATTIGKDNSGNGNNWTPNNISVTTGVTYDSMLDVPTPYADGGNGRGNYAVMNPLWQGRTNAPTNGNLDYPASSVGIGTMDVSLFFSYWEITSTGGTTTTSVYSTSAATTVGVTTGLTYGFRFNSSTGALDYTTNGSSFTSLATGLTSGPYFVYVSTAASTTASFNGGQRSFTYTPPTGYVALNTQNLPTPTISNGATVMAASTYTGTGATQSIANSGNNAGAISFKPDLVWIKSRSAATNNNLFDSVRGTTNYLISNSTAAEATNANTLTAFGTTGFTLGSDAGSVGVNVNAATYVAWQWQAGQGSSSSNTSGSITSTVSVNATAGFSVVTYTGNGTSGATIGHGLGVAPKMVIAKLRNSAGFQWSVYHASLASASSYIYLNSTAAQATDATYWGTAPTSSVFTVGTNANTNNSTSPFVAYCFAAVAGYSAFGSYTGNGSADGPFVYLGFRPRWVMVKRTDSTSDWYIWDTSRDTYNVEAATLLADTSGAETSATSIDDLSNGFKCRSATVVNVSTGTYIYAAFAENPFKYSLAR